MSQLADKVVAYRLPDDGGEEMYGLCIRREGDTLRVMVLQKEDNREAPLKSVLRKLSDEDRIVNSLEARFNSLQSQLAKERNAGSQTKNYRLQETMLQWATHRVEGIDPEEWRRFALERHPSAVVKAVGCAAASIAAGAKLVSSNWVDAQRLFSKSKEIAAEVRKAGEQRMNKALYNVLEEGYISDPSLSYALVAQESPSLGILHKWITALVDYQRARYIEDDEAELQQQLTGCHNSLQSAKERRGSLMVQAELINTGNCYIRTQTVRSVPIECVLSLMTAEKVTTRQYLLKEAAPLELLDEVVSSRQPVSARSIRGSRQEDSLAHTGSLSARTMGAPSRCGNCTNAGVEIPPIPIPKVESARVGTWAGGRVVRKPPPPANEAGGGVAAATPKTSPQLASASAAVEAAKFGAQSPITAANGVPRSGAAAAPSASSSSTAPSPRDFATARIGGIAGELASQGRALSARHGGAEAMQVLTDVKNNFQSVQAVLLDCLEDYQKLEDKYASTVEHSRQLLQTLEGRDQMIARLQQELAATTTAVAVHAGDAANSVPAVHPCNAGVHSPAKRRNLDDMYISGSETPNAPCADDLVDENSFEQRFENMLYDTLEFLQGADSIPDMYETEASQA